MDEPNKERTTQTQCHPWIGHLDNRLFDVRPPPTSATEHHGSPRLWLLSDGFRCNTNYRNLVCPERPNSLVRTQQLPIPPMLRKFHPSRREDIRLTIFAVTLRLWVTPHGRNRRANGAPLQRQRQPRILDPDRLRRSLPHVLMYVKSPPFPNSSFPILSSTHSNIILTHQSSTCSSTSTPCTPGPKAPQRTQSTTDRGLSRAPESLAVCAIQATSLCQTAMPGHRPRLSVTLRSSSWRA